MSLEGDSFLFESISLDNLSKVTSFIKQECFLKSPFFFFIGEMGSGKTTLIRLLLKDMQVETFLGSPSFNYINSYKLEEIKYKECFHMDLDRISLEEELAYVGVEDVLLKQESLFLMENAENYLSFFGLASYYCIEVLEDENWETRSFKIQFIEKKDQ